MKAVLIDDEEPALAYLERLLRADGRVEIVGMYTSAEEGLLCLAENQVDIVFLDIGMPQMNGLEAAEHFQRVGNGVRIVYITAYSEHALKAFELNALDYLLKPIDRARIGKTLDRIEEYVKLAAARRSDADRSDGRLVRCFKQLEIVSESAGSSREHLRWRTKKAQELFAYLIHIGDSRVSKERLIETLWPEVDYDKATTYLHHSISRIRSLMKRADLPFVIEYTDESYRLLMGGIRTDVQLFERGLAKPERPIQENWNHYEQLLSLYRGDYLEDHDYEWAGKKREELRRRYLDIVCDMARLELEEGKARPAVQRLLAAQEKDPYSDEICRLLLSAYVKLKDQGALRRCFASFAALLKEELGVKPEPQTEEFFARWDKLL